MALFPAHGISSIAPGLPVPCRANPRIEIPLATLDTVDGPARNGRTARCDARPGTWHRMHPCPALIRIAQAAFKESLAAASSLDNHGPPAHISIRLCTHRYLVMLRSCWSLGDHPLSARLPGRYLANTGSLHLSHFQFEPKPLASLTLFPKGRTLASRRCSPPGWLQPLVAVRPHCRHFRSFLDVYPLICGASRLGSNFARMWPKRKKRPWPSKRLLQRLAEPQRLSFWRSMTEQPTEMVRCIDR